MRARWLPAGVVLSGLCDPAGSLAAGDAEPGEVILNEVILKKCYACDSVLPGVTGLTGPNLSGAVGRAVASAPDLEYSDGLEASPTQGYRRWTEAALDAFITSPEDFVPGATMTFVGMQGPAERADLIACLGRSGAGSGEE